MEIDAEFLEAVKQDAERQKAEMLGIIDQAKAVMLRAEGAIAMVETVKAQLAKQDINDK